MTLTKNKLISITIATILILSATTLATPAYAATVDLDGTIRDFNDTHPDMEAVVSGLVTGLVDSSLAVDKNPVLEFLTY